jgi:hypothetical protein
LNVIFIILRVPGVSSCIRALKLLEGKEGADGVTAACQEEDSGKLKKLKYFRVHQIVWDLIKWEDL